MYIYIYIYIMIVVLKPCYFGPLLCYSTGWLNSSQVKWDLISSVTAFVYELPQKLPNDLRFSIL